MLILDDISVRMAGRLLIDHASLNLPSGTKAGLVGRNGAGKSTLFKVITGEMHAETGEVHLPRNLKIGQVAQEAPGTEDSLIEIVLAADTERTALLAEAETATDPHRIADIHIRLADIDAHSAEARAGAILSGLGFDAEAQKRPASSFSGGWRMRVALASVLFAEPDLLLLDEPTNYLDLEGTLWLEDYVRRYPHTVILISHDRDLLNSAVNSIVHLDQTKLTLWQGNYDQFERLRSEALELQQKQRTKQEAHRKHMEAFVERFRAKASKAKQAQSRLKALQKLKPIAAVIEDHVQPFHFPEPAKIVASPIIAIESGSVGYEPGKPILRQLNLRIDADDRIALLGSNGNGKSTFAKLISGRLPLDGGKMTVAPNLKISFFAQHQLDDLIPEDNAIEHVRKLMPDAPEAKVRARVAQMGLATVKMNTAAKDLSGGEKARLLMGLATFDGPNLLILDEPTNHLDIDSREALMHALNDFDGAVVLIAHDRHLIEATMDRLWLVRDGGVAPYDGDLDAYRALVLADAKAERSGNRINAEEGQKLSKAEQRKLAAQKREALKPLQKKIQEAEAKMQRFQKKIDTLQEQLADPVIYTREPARATQIGKEIGYAKSSLAVAEEEWLALSSEFEAAMAEL
ncbi:ABC-F family ATP-binding cassette domain-containing protein [Phyllobacterium sp. 0TCS1.6C]|uniref:ABC-F family ATP-binding cassette domain-containing protein n=1 Tax=unclassified Phyllobacterium TaxID=2638441 RepID=UPI0022656DB7|nr:MULTISPECIES: ABC-F family ATP-binding cassette domain-containing protein [unclassified Phyllobacterium]MCX8280478.1 ABC-F family ATP-binding cassette domain-containing protein [Phyllobacterium sp. 0TCS1.6C]MCX8295073.1 ABC-F family ATP-binding cassette domain-containing protein [Phyllobacterium sp. 0TCS1.6A]